MPRSFRLTLLIALVAVIAPASALAAPIVLYNTGAASPGFEDPNWDLLGGTAYVTNGWPVGSAWMANTAASKWISPSPRYTDPATNVINASDGSGVTYHFQTTFQIPAPYDPQWSWFTFRVAVDNQLTQVYLNGTPLDIQYIAGSPVTSSSFTKWSNYFTVDDYFVTGTNTLTFDVYNGIGGSTGNPAGLRVEFGSSSTVPEPASLALLGIGLVGAAGLARRRRRR